MNRRQYLKAVPVFAAVSLAGCLGDETDYSEYSDEELMPPESDIESAMPDWEAEQYEDDLRGIRCRISPTSDDGNNIYLGCESHEDEDVSAEDYRNSDHYGDEDQQLDVGDEGYYKVHWDGAGGGIDIQFYLGAARASIHRLYPPEEFETIEEAVPEYYHDLMDVTLDHWEQLEE